MKDITRIHIAKIPYSIELPAKKELESYIRALEAYTADSELLQDIEIRITELLLERGVKQEDVVSLADVKAVREQLGEPKEFMTDEATGEADAELLADTGVRKLYRNLDTAVLGGVLSGIASYLRIDVLWVRLAFIALFFVSAGLFAVLYVVAWLIIPAARTAAEKLQMAGRPVTLASIREVNETSPAAETDRRQALTKRVLTMALGVSAVLVAVGSAIMLLIVAMQLLLGQDIEDISSYKLPLTLMFLSGALLIALSMVVAMAAFTQKFNKRIWVSAVIITILGLTSFGTAVTTGYIQGRTDIETAQRNMVERSDTLPESFLSVKTLTVDVPESTNVTYVVDASSSTIKQKIPKDSKKAVLLVENGSATLSMDQPQKQLHSSVESTITIYGPALEDIAIKHGYVTYEVDSQPSLRVDALNSATFSLAQSRIDTLNATLNDSATLSGENAAITTVGLILEDDTSVSLGNIKTLSVKSPDSCALNATAEVTVQNILSQTYELNGTQVASKTTEEPCFALTVQRDEE